MYIICALACGCFFWFNVIICCPIISKFNDRPDHYRSIAHIANELENVMQIDIEPYHPLGISKLLRLGKELTYENRSFLDMDLAIQVATFIQSETKVMVSIK